MGLDTMTYWLTNRQSQRDIDFDFDFENEVSRSSDHNRERPEWNESWTLVYCEIL
jgi:hypothetical protein